MTHDEMIALIEAHRDGQTIQYRLSPKAEWRDRHLKSLDFDFSDVEYRIKPKPLTLSQCWDKAMQLTITAGDVLQEFLKLAKENGHV
jgi:hypothetical protein